MIWYIISIILIIITGIYGSIKITKEQKVWNKFKSLLLMLVISLIIFGFFWTLDSIMGSNIPFRALTFSKTEINELISYPNIEKQIYTYIDSNKYDVIEKRNNIVEPKSYYNSDTTSVKMKFIKSNKAYIEIYKSVGFKDKNVQWLTTYVPKHYKKYYICIPENTFVIKDGE
jgi:energy-coupling factor transporter transmembrane protein EcfT